jgi:beta-glucosidase
VDVYLDRPAIVAPFLDDIASLIVNFGAHDEAFVRVLFGELEPLGKLPFELPSSMDAVLANLADVPDDTADPTFPFGSGLRYENWVHASAPHRDPLAAADISTARWDLDKSPLGDILDDPESSAIIGKYVPELIGNPMVAMARAMSLNAVLGMAASNVDTARLDNLRSELSAL